MRFRILAIAAFLLSSAVFAVSSFAAGYKPEERYERQDERAGPAPYKSKRARHAPYRNCCEGYRFVYAESWQGFKRVVAPVRKARLGEEVRLPGGSWVYCEFSCEYTLRKQSLDFWEGVVKQDDSVSPGLFRKDFYLDHPRRY